MYNSSLKLIKRIIDFLFVFIEATLLMATILLTMYVSVLFTLLLFVMVFCLPMWIVICLYLRHIDDVRKIREMLEKAAIIGEKESAYEENAQEALASKSI